MRSGRSRGLRSRIGRSRRTGRLQNGVGLLVVLIMVATAAAGVSVAAQRWSDQASRDRERELLRVGDAYAAALAAYRDASPGSERRYPSSLEELLLDTRVVGTRRHLRRLYADPLTGQADWVLVRDARGDISGLRSRSERAPWMRQSQRLRAADLPPADKYADWVFTPRSAS